MASDRFEDEYDDGRGDRPRRPRGDRTGAAKSKVLGPAIGLIVIGVFLVLGAGINVISGLTGNLGPAFADAKQKQFEQLDANNQLSDDQKKQQKEMLTTVFDSLEKYWVPGNGLVGLANLVVVLGGVQMLRLKSRGLAMTASVMAMIPCFTSACCVIGIPVGIWALVTLGNPDVKAAFAAADRPATFDDLGDRG